MANLLIIAVVSLLVIAACDQLAPRVGLASPLALLALGAAFGFLPWVQAIEVDPEIILEVVLPPLLFSAAVAMPVTDFRRELRAISGLAIGLVVISALIVGVVVHALVPALPLPWAIALGAVLSPTDAVAVSIARRVGVNHRIITVLEGEGLFNDATALVLLSSAVSAGLMAADDALSPLTLAEDFAVALLAAIVVGWAVGEVAVRVRARISEPAADTVVSFVVPFVASVPAEHLGGSGLVAAVVAGLVVSYRGPRLIPPANRRAAETNWHTVNLVLEGGVFLVMGLQAFGIAEQLAAQPYGKGLRWAVLVAVVAGLVTVLVRAGVVAVLLAWLRRVRLRKQARLRANVERFSLVEERLDAVRNADTQEIMVRGYTPAQRDAAVERWENRLARGRRQHRRAKSDMDYFTAMPLGPREGVVLVWAGMRGAVTLAAAQTLPLATPMRGFLLMVALLVASGSLVIQGLTLPALVRRVHPADEHDDDASDAADTTRLQAILDRATAQACPEGTSELQRIRARRSALLDACSVGEFSSRTLAIELERLDAAELFIDRHVS